MNGKFDKSWPKIVKIYIKKLRLGSKMRMSEENWQDLEQICLIKAWKNQKQYNPSFPLHPWIKTVVHNTYKNYLRDNFFGDKKLSKISKQQRLNVIMAKSISSVKKFEEEDNTYPYETVEAVDPKTFDYSFNKINCEALNEILSVKEKDILNLKLSGLNLLNVSKELDLYYWDVWKLNESIKIKYLQLLNN